MYENQRCSNIPPPRIIKASSPDEDVSSGVVPRGVDPINPGGVRDNTEPQKETAKVSAEVNKTRIETRPGGGELMPFGGDAILIEGEEKPFEERSPSPNGTGFSESTPAVKQGNFSLGLAKFVCSAVCILVVLWLFSLSSPFLANAIALDGWRAWLSLAIAALPIAAIVGISIYAFRRFRNIPRINQYDARFISTRALREKLEAEYLSTFKDVDNYIEENGFTNISKPIVKDCIKRLRGEIPADYSDSTGWLHDFETLQKLQDERGEQIIAHYWKLVGIQTAGSPWKMIDMLSVLYNSSAMIASLGRLYNRRTSPQGAFRLACRWIINIFAARELGDVTANIAGTGGQAAAASLKGMSDWMATVCKPVASLLGKAAEGSANAFLVYRLGHRAMEYFRPLR